MKNLYFLFALALIPFQSIAQSPCTLDPSFNTSGMLVSTYNRVGQTLVLQPDGKTIVGCNYWGSGVSTLIIRRLNVNGSLDNTFGTNGDLTFSVAEKATRIVDIKLYNGNIYLAGTTTTNIGGTNTFAFIAAIDASGQFINTFGTNGVKKFNSSPKLYKIDAIEIDKNGFIYAAGLRTSSNNFLMKLNSTDGQLVNTFNSTGIKYFAPSNAEHRYDLNDMIIESNGNILVSGKKHKVNNGSGGSFWNALVIRFLPNGTEDNTFATNGIGLYNSNPTYFQEASNIHVNSAGDYITTGVTYDGSDYDYSALKLKSNGTPDASFGTNGWQIHDLTYQGKTESTFNSVLLPDERILLTGNVGTNDTVYFSMLMLHPDGTRDNNFAPAGLYKNFFNSKNNSTSYGVGIDPTGKITLSGYTRSCSGGVCGPLYLAVARYIFDIGSPLTVKNSKSKNSLIIFPNPVKGNGNIYFKGDDKIHGVKIYSLSGSLVCTSFDTKINMLSLNNLSAGTYLVAIELENEVLVKELLIK